VAVAVRAAVAKLQQPPCGEERSTWSDRPDVQAIEGSKPKEKLPATQAEYELRMAKGDLTTTTQRSLLSVHFAR
jgi:hypothetical protein